MLSEKIPPIRSGMAIRSLRNSDFDARSAICEVIDNSIQAGAKEIKIKVILKTPPGKRILRPTKIIFGDDGKGMSMKILQYCLQLGYSDRYDDRKGIGRFGVGMTFGAISVCQKIEVYSRQKQQVWNYTYLDISQINEKVDPEIHPIEPKNLPNEFSELVGDHGTLVIWDKIDRIEYDENRLIKDLGRIYRKFIAEFIIQDEKIIPNPNKRVIMLNGKKSILVILYMP